MRITVFGASGKVGSLVVEEALRRGYKVTAFVHSHDLFAPTGQLGIIKGDIYNAADITKALQGSDAVVSCLGSWGTKKRTVLTAAMENVLPAMREHKIDRIVTLTGSGARTPDRQGDSLLLKLLAPFPAGKVFADGENHMKLLAGSGLDWTTLRSPVMTNGGKKGYQLDSTAGNPLETISRQAVVAALLDQLNAGDYSRQAPVIHRK